MVLPCKTVYVDVVFPILAGASPRLPRSRVGRDDESVMDELEEKPDVEKHPVMNLAPVRKIVGFDDGHSDSEES